MYVKKKRTPLWYPSYFDLCILSALFVFYDKVNKRAYKKYYTYNLRGGKSEKKAPVGISTQKFVKKPYNRVAEQIHCKQPALEYTLFQEIRKRKE